MAIPAPSDASLENTGLALSHIQMFKYEQKLYDVGKEGPLETLGPGKFFPDSRPLDGPVVILQSFYAKIWLCWEIA